MCIDSRWITIQVSMFNAVFELGNLFRCSWSGILVTLTLKFSLTWHECHVVVWANYQRWAVTKKSCAFKSFLDRWHLNVKCKRVYAQQIWDICSFTNVDFSPKIKFEHFLYDLSVFWPKKAIIFLLISYFAVKIKT